MAQIKTNLQYGVTGSLQTASYSSLDATKLSGNLPALNASALTNLDARDLENALPAISGASLTGVSAGKILQVVSATSNTTFDIYSTTETTTLSCAITPSATSSKVLIMFAVPRAENSDPTQDGAKRIRYFLLRGSTKIFTGGQDSSFSVTSGGDANHETISGMVVDSPSTTSATTYNINYNTNTAETNGRWNRANTNYAGTMSIVLMEIDGS